MRRVPLHWQIIVGMAIGFATGWALNASVGPEAATATSLWQALNGISSIFLKLLKLVVIPLVFFSLIEGMLGMGDLTRFGRLGLRTFGLYVATSFLAIVTGRVLVNVIRPGDGTGIRIPTEPVEHTPPGSFWDVVVEMIPDNVFRAATDFDLLGVIVFALLFGGCLLGMSPDRRRPIAELVTTLSDVMMRMVGFVIALAPIGIAALIARLVSTTGPAVFVEMWRYMLTVFLALATHFFVTLPLLVYFVRRKNPYRFLKAMSPAFLTAFSTASSSGTLGVTLERAEHGVGISPRVSSFVLPLGATINMDGTALYEIVTVLFIAQLHAAADPTFVLTAGQQALIVFLGLAVSIGAAGIPHAGLVMMVIILQAVGLPIEYTGLIWTVDRVLDMCRTATNVASDSSINLIVAHLEGEVDDSVLWADAENA